MHRTRLRRSKVAVCLLAAAIVPSSLSACDGEVMDEGSTKNDAVDGERMDQGSVASAAVEGEVMDRGSTTSDAVDGEGVNEGSTTSEAVDGERISYGSAPQQYGALSVPGGSGPFPVVVLVHGGFWRNAYDLSLMDGLGRDLVDRGYAVWNLEYRRVGDPGGGWPGTLVDVADGVDELTTIADEHPLDLHRVATVGHSAGGHLALWAAGRAGLGDDAPGADPLVMPIVAVGQGAVVDLIGAADAPLGNGAAIELLGGTPADVPDRYHVATPALRVGPTIVSVVGSDDDIVPPAYSIDPADPEAVRLIEIPGADHFDLIDPEHPAWAAVVAVLDATLR